MVRAILSTLVTVAFLASVAVVMFFSHLIPEPGDGPWAVVLWVFMGLSIIGFVAMMYLTFRGQMKGVGTEPKKNDGTFDGPSSSVVTPPD